jgi:hypothetical protein
MYYYVLQMFSEHCRGVDSVSGAVGRGDAHFSKTARSGAPRRNFWAATQKWATRREVGHPPERLIHQHRRGPPAELTRIL